MFACQVDKSAVCDCVFPSYTELLDYITDKEKILFFSSTKDYSSCHLKVRPSSVHFIVALIMLHEKQNKAIFENILNKP